ncbi:putative proline-rich receptor-like protein kinase PERK3 [Iris pallida]|uniref:Proline-rich receptor-like protein kinase PERK3 n=1 Tax=Iris pallida TaxID=29817 RepID=A0AAX6F5Y3_IRIPA|nr:putative proline-rich receptor-like protein kinase PERK3 [Iris pallida]
MFFFYFLNCRRIRGVGYDEIVEFVIKSNGREEGQGHDARTSGCGIWRNNE